MSEEELVTKRSLAFGLGISMFGILLQSYHNCEYILSSCVVSEGLLKILL